MKEQKVQKVSFPKNLYRNQMNSVSYPASISRGKQVCLLN